MNPPVRNVLGHTLHALGEAIVAGRHPVGSSIPPEPTMCETYGVSRTVVREVIKSLVAQGIVSTRPNVGIRVLAAEQWNWFDPDVLAWQSKAGQTKAFLRDLQELRRVVEPAAVRLAAEGATAADLAAVEDAYARMKRAIDEGATTSAMNCASTRACCAPSTTACRCRWARPSARCCAPVSRSPPAGWLARANRCRCTARCLMRSSPASGRRPSRRSWCSSTARARISNSCSARDAGCRR